jgi:hypothetical protein
VGHSTYTSYRRIIVRLWKTETLSYTIRYDDDDAESRSAQATVHDPSKEWINTRQVISNDWGLTFTVAWVIIGFECSCTV